MAARGAKPKPTHLRIVDGTHRPARHGDVGQALNSVDAASGRFGKLTQPKRLKGDAATAWKRYIAPAWWLDASREASAIAFCELWQEFLFCPTGFAAAKHGQLRAYMSELGLTDERNRGDSGSEGKDEFFD